jgi:AraC-like DNA-binding protein
MATGAPERIVVSVTGADEVAASFETALGGSVDVRQEEGVEPRLTISTVRTGRLASTRWRTAGVTDGTRDAPETDCSTILTGVVLGGEVGLRCRDDVVDTSRPFVYADRISSWLVRPDVANLAIASEAVESHARALTGLDEIRPRFTAFTPDDPAADRLWRDTTVYLARALDTLAGQEASPLADTALVDLAAAVVLRVFPNTAREAEHLRDLHGARTAALRRALQHVDDHLAEPISVVDLAEAAGLGLRGLHAAFRRHLDTTPMEHVRRARLAAARQELLAAEPGEGAVDRVAARWGFVRTRRFVQRYREAYGETPAETLDR